MHSLLHCGRMAGGPTVSDDQRMDLPDIVAMLCRLVRACDLHRPSDLRNKWVLHRGRGLWHLHGIWGEHWDLRPVRRLGPASNAGLPLNSLLLGGMRHRARTGCLRKSTGPGRRPGHREFWSYCHPRQLPQVNAQAHTDILGRPIPHGARDAHLASRSAPLRASAGVSSRRPGGSSTASDLPSRRSPTSQAGHLTSWRRGHAAERNRPRAPGSGSVDVRTLRPTRSKTLHMRSSLSSSQVHSSPSISTHASENQTRSPPRPFTPVSSPMSSTQRSSSTARLIALARDHGSGAGSGTTTRRGQNAYHYPGLAPCQGAGVFAPLLLEFWLFSATDSARSSTRAQGCRCSASGTTA